MTWRYLIRFGLVVVGFALITFGLLEWQDRRFSLAGFWPLDGPMRLHPLHLLILGIAMIPAAVWEIFLLDRHRADSPRDHHGDGA
jgi:hypothetical protein